MVNITSGLLNIVDVTVESQSSFHIGGAGTVSWRGAVLVFRQKFTLDDAIEFHAFAGLEALACV